MAVDVKSRAKRYEKLDFLGEGQVRLSGIGGPEQRAPSHLTPSTGYLVEARGLTWLLVVFGRGCPEAAAASLCTLKVIPEPTSPF